MTQDHLDTLNAHNIKHAAKVQELTTVNDQQNQNHLKAQAAKQANFDDEKNAHIAELNNLRNEFKKRDAQYVKDLEELNSKNAAYVRQLQTNYSSELNKRDEALAVLNNNYQNDLMANEKKHADFLRHEQAKF
jgi:Skp family chaperone for outer membrane proteins